MEKQSARSANNGMTGGLIGVLAFHIGKATLSLSTSGGALVAGLFSAGSALNTPTMPRSHNRPCGS